MTDIRTVVLLAAGQGSRLRPWTDHLPKCMVPVAGVAMVDRLLRSLAETSVERVVVATGHGAQALRAHLEEWSRRFDIDEVPCSDFATTNNVVSLQRALAVVDEGALIVESDVVADSRLWAAMTRSGRCALGRFDAESMNGTTATVDAAGRVVAMHLGGLGPRPHGSWKTVNATSLARADVALLRAGLESCVASGATGVYYEQEIARLVAAGSLSLRAVDFDAGRWFEVDTPDDLAIADRLFGAYEAPSLARPRDAARSWA